jgi:hypothetical protein
MYVLNTHFVDKTVEGADDAWLNFICNGDGAKIFTGDHLESASTADPSFWVIHPTLERLLHAKLMAGGFETADWAADGHSDFVCNKFKCYNSTTNKIDYYPECCYGHFENDKLLDAISGDRYLKVGPTNAEMVQGTDPRSENYNMLYIYDNFEYDHCEQDFDGLFAELYENMQSTGKSKRPRQLAQIETRAKKALKLLQNKQA